MKDLKLIQKPQNFLEFLLEFFGKDFLNLKFQKDMKINSLCLLMELVLELFKTQEMLFKCQQKNLMPLSWDQKNSTFKMRIIK